MKWYEWVLSPFRVSRTVKLMEHVFPGSDEAEGSFLEYRSFLRWAGIVLGSVYLIYLVVHWPVHETEWPGMVLLIVVLSFTFVFAKYFCGRPWEEGETIREVKKIGYMGAFCMSMAFPVFDQWVIGIGINRILGNGLCALGFLLAFFWGVILMGKWGMMLGKRRRKRRHPA